MGRKKERQESGHNGDKELLKRLHCNTRATPRRQGCALFAPSTGPPAPQAPQQRNGRESAPRMGARQLPNGTGHSAPHAQPVGLHECDCDNSSHYFACRHSPPSPVRTLAHMPSSLSHRFPRAVPFLLVPSKTISIPLLYRLGLWSPKKVAKGPACGFVCFTPGGWLAELGPQMAVAS